MSGWAIAGIIAGVFIFDFVFVSFLLRAGWSMVAKPRFAAREPAPDAVRREFQSISINMFNFGFCVHIAVDESHLHLFPAALIRWVGGRPVSIPWDAIQVQKLGRRTSKARLGHDTLRAPTWALSIAQK